MNRWRVRVGRNRKRAARPEGRQATDRPEHRNDGAEADRRRLADRPHQLVLADQALSREFEMTTLRLHRLTFVDLAVAGLGACTQVALSAQPTTSPSAQVVVQSADATHAPLPPITIHQPPTCGGGAA